MIFQMRRWGRYKPLLLTLCRQYRGSLQLNRSSCAVCHRHLAVEGLPFIRSAGHRAKQMAFRPLRQQQQSWPETIHGLVYSTTILPGGGRKFLQAALCPVYQTG